MSLTVCPITFREACAFVAAHHRHHKAPRGCRFTIGLENIVGVAIVGRPSARHLDDGRTAEVTRLCVLSGPPGLPGACSKLYAACWRAARAIGYRRLVTYTLPEEGGASLRGAGWKLIGEAGGGSWSRTDRPRVDMHPTQVKLRWEAT